MDQEGEITLSIISQSIGRVGELLNMTRKRKQSVFFCITSCCSFGLEKVSINNEDNDDINNDATYSNNYARDAEEHQINGQLMLLFFLFSLLHTFSSVGLFQVC